jgi:multidrug efflux pump subunit AcrB
MKIRLRFPMEFATNAEELGSFPVGLNGKIVPLKAIAQVSREEVNPSILREDGYQMFLVEAWGKQDERKKTAESIKKAEALLQDWDRSRSEVQKKRDAMIGSLAGPNAKQGLDVPPAKKSSEKPRLQLEDSQKELNEAIRQLALAVSLSIGLIFLTMIFQFGSVMNALLVLVAVPLGFIGVVLSLFIFQSTLSLNSLLGVILLNGLAVANSIILVDFLQRKVKEGVAPGIAAVEVARVRMRPILMTSLTTGLGMLPIALGIGEGGKILQPLGIAVAGGLGFSMVTTLFIVPSLQVSWIEYQQKRTREKGSAS